ncbi:MAG: class I SAM-dependent methyltransferase [Bacteroidetes bacterium]|nr:class I SAM-dependent methyltransferase [Bacteroidota bacterium]
MQTKEKTVDWHLYAEKYDMLFSYNPFYQELYKEITKLTLEWDLKPGATIADIGAGTGNYSVTLAKQFPQASILHVDNNVEMNERARQKKEDSGLENLKIIPKGIQEVRLPSESLDGLISVHALYTFPHPAKALKKMAAWLAPGGFGILVDPGRIVNVLDWQWAIGKKLIAQYGIRKTLEIFREAKPVSRQNRYIRQMQRQEKLWTHSTEEFCEAIKNAGFKILDFKTCFRGLSDLAVVSR